MGAGIGLLIGAVAVWFFGQWVNHQRPEQKLNEVLAQRGQMLHAAADNGTFHLGPGHQAPRNVAEAHQQAEWLLASEREKTAKAMRNRNTLFFIPVQWIAIPAAVAGVALVVVGLTGNG